MRDLEPRALWNYFYEITRIPRPSKKEERMTAYLKAFADKQALPVKVDAAGNVLISKAASPGYEQAKTIARPSIPIPAKPAAGAASAANGSGRRKATAWISAG